MDLNQIKVFVRVAQAGSFSQAAKQLGMPKSTVSAKVSALEKRLGVTLLQRTTRQLRLTDAGTEFLRACVEGLASIQHGEDELLSAQREIAGILRVTAPIDLGSHCLVGLVSRFAAAHPRVKLDFQFSDRYLDLVAEGVDVAIRAGELKDSALVGKRLGTALWVCYASRSYLKKRGKPVHPKDLRAHTCLRFAPLGEESWTLANGKSSISVPVQGPVVANDSNMIKALCLAGQGVAILPTFATQAEVGSGEPVRLLPDWWAGRDPIHVVYPGQKFAPPKVKAFVEAAVETFRAVLKE